MRYTLICAILILFFCFTESVMVRMTDRKPKWAVARQEPPPRVETESINERDPPPPIHTEEFKEEAQEKIVQEPAVDIHSIHKNRAPAEFSGKI